MSFYDDHIKNAYWNDRFYHIAAGESYSLAITNQGGIHHVGNFPPPTVNSPKSLFDLGSYGYYILETDGTVKYIGSNSHGQGNISTEVDVVQIATYSNAAQAVFLYKDGTIKAFGNNAGTLNGKIQNFTGVTQVAIGSLCFALKADGSVVSEDGAPVSGFTDIKFIEAFQRGLVGIKNDGTCVATHLAINSEVQNWTDIIQIAMGHSQNTGVTGLREDGTVVTTTGIDVSGLTGITEIAISNSSNLESLWIMGVTAAGTMQRAGNATANSDVTGWADVATEVTYILSGTTALDRIPGQVDVAIHHATTRNKIDLFTSAPDGTYSSRISRRWPVYVTAYADGHKPETHGPILPPGV